MSARFQGQSSCKEAGTPLNSYCQSRSGADHRLRLSQPPAGTRRSFAARLLCALDRATRTVDQAFFWESLISRYLAASPLLWPSGIATDRSILPLNIEYVQTQLILSSCSSRSADHRHRFSIRALPCPAQPRPDLCRPEGQSGSRPALVSPPVALARDLSYRDLDEAAVAASLRQDPRQRLARRARHQNRQHRHLRRLSGIDAYTPERSQVLFSRIEQNWQAPAHWCHRAFIAVLAGHTGYGRHVQVSPGPDIDSNSRSHGRPITFARSASPDRVASSPRMTL